MSKGWECPRCGDVYGPNVAKCTNVDCKPAPRSKDGDLGDAITDEDLHEALYSPSIRQFPDGSRGKKRRGGSGESDGSTGIY